MFVSTHPEFTARHRRKILSACLIASLVIAGIAGWQAWDQEKEATAARYKIQHNFDDQKKQYSALEDSFGKVNEQFVEQNAKLDQLASQNAELSSGLGKVADSAHLPSGIPLAQLVQEIIGKLPKESVTVKGRGNVTSINQSGGQTARTIVNQAKPPEFKVIENSPFIADQKGGYLFSPIIEVIADSPPNNMLITVDGLGITGIDVVALNMNLVNSHSDTQPEKNSVN